MSLQQITKNILHKNIHILFTKAYCVQMTKNYSWRNILAKIPIRIAVLTHCQINEIHVQIMRFTCCLNMGLNLKILNMSPKLLAWRYGKCCWPDWLSIQFWSQSVPLILTKKMITHKLCFWPQKQSVGSFDWPNHSSYPQLIILNAFRRKRTDWAADILYYFPLYVLG